MWLTSNYTVVLTSLSETPEPPRSLGAPSYTSNATWHDRSGDSSRLGLRMMAVIAAGFFFSFAVPCNLMGEPRDGRNGLWMGGRDEPALGIGNRPLSCIYTYAARARLGQHLKQGYTGPAARPSHENVPSGPRHHAKATGAVKRWAEAVEFHPSPPSFPPLQPLSCSTASDSDLRPNTTSATAKGDFRSPVFVRLKMTPQGTASNHSLQVVK